MLPWLILVAVPLGTAGLAMLGIELQARRRERRKSEAFSAALEFFDRPIPDRYRR